MDWIRRNWPDMLIGIALVAVIAGIIATLLTGGSFFPLGQSDSTSDRPRSSQSSSTAAGTSLTGAAQAGSTSNLPGASRDSAGNAGAASAANGTGTGEVAPQGGVEVTALPIPGAGEASANSSDRAQSAANGGDAATGTNANAAANTGGTADSDMAGQDSTAVTPAQSASTSGEAEGLYRISVGAFSSEENAERQAAAFRAAGYPVFIGSQGDLSIVLVGPYDDQAEAERIAARIRSGDFQIEPVIYRFRPEETADRTASSREQSGPAPAPAASAPAPQPTASQAAGARFLQVGAYGSAGSAEPQRNRLEGIGFRVTERSEGNLVKLLVGPFAGDELTAARSLLNEQGIEHFPR
ncbi:MAG: SPOR domain-containing protein [Trueperaceae bacterium]